MNSFPKQKPWRSKAYREFVRRHRCVYEGMRKWKHWPVVTAHIRRGTDGGMALKPSDGFTVPLCERCHEIDHKHPDQIHDDFDVFRVTTEMLMEFIGRGEK